MDKKKKTLRYWLKTKTSKKAIMEYIDLYDSKRIAIEDIIYFLKHKNDR